MLIGLIDIDSKLPNLALMKISSYHKKLGHRVTLAGPINYGMCDKLYASSLFNDSLESNLPSKALIGGPGFNLNRLPIEIENSDPDYDLYPGCQFSWQRFSTGCVRNCEFCIVHKLEGGIKSASPMKLNPRGKWVYLLDNNFFASENWKESICALKSYKQPVQFEGIDIRVLTDEMVTELNGVKRKSQFHIAWDNPGIDISGMIEKVIPKNIRYKFMCYVLIGFKSSKEEDYYRVMKLREIGVDPFVMPYNKQDEYQRNFARWVNHKAIFKSVRWEDYNLF